MSDKKPSFFSRLQRYLFSGILTLIPLWLTWILFDFLLSQLSNIGKPAAALISNTIGYGNYEWLTETWVQAIISVVLTVVFIILVGYAANKIVGRKLIDVFEQTIEYIPLVEKIYGATKKLLSALQQKPDEVQRVVLIQFPSQDMKVVGFVTRTLTDEDTGETIAAVYVPTTPNPTSGYLELVPIEYVTSTDWTMDEAMSFIISGGAVSRETINYRSSKTKQGQVPLQDMDKVQSPDGEVTQKTAEAIQSERD
ncbi:MAG: DUF502 domain-containing protein [Alphaproteobacteria bacterium]|nr:DUF502 domain-containing protein [Alphaproteobacteria bacterium]